MRKYLLKMNQLGFKQTDLSNALKKAVQEFEEGENEYNQLKEQLEAMEETDEQYEEISTQVQEYETLLEESDVELEEKIQKFSDNKAEYDKKVKQMQAANEAKKAKKAAASAAPPAPAPAPAPNPVPAPAPAPAPNPPVVILNPNDPPKVEEKKDSFGSWLLWGGLAVLGLVVGVNVMKNKE